MMAEELGIIEDDGNPAKDGIVNFCSFVLFGIVPLIPYIVGHLANTEKGLFPASTVMTAIIMFVLGLIKSTFMASTFF